MLPVKVELVTVRLPSAEAPSFPNQIAPPRPWVAVLPEKVEEVIVIPGPPRMTAPPVLPPPDTSGALLLLNTVFVRVRLSPAMPPASTAPPPSEQSAGGVCVPSSWLQVAPDS